MTMAAGETTVQLYALNEAERQTARKRARELAISKLGDKPDRRNYNRSTIGDYPGWFTWSVVAMLGLAFAGAFAASAFNVFSAGRDHYLATIGAADQWQAVIVGIAVVLLAEFLTIASVLAARILLTGRPIWQAVMLIPIILGVVIAVTANAVMAQPAGFWPWLVTVSPPVSVVFLSLILEQLTLADIKRRHANEREYRLALQEWSYRTADPEGLPGWRMIYANELRDAIRSKNAAGRGRAERESIMATLTGQEWSALVWREFDADQWLEDRPANPTQPGRPEQSQPGQLAIIPAAPSNPARMNGRH